MPQTVLAPLLAQLPPHLRSHPDDEVRFFLGWWQRMHTRRRPLVADALKFVTWAEDGVAPQRYVWEVCRWPSRDSFQWTFVCWMIDGVGMWLRSFSSKRAALTYFRQAPAAVLHRSPQPQSDGVPNQAAS